MRKQKPNQPIVFPAFHAAQAEIHRGITANRRTVIRAGRRFGKTIMLETAAADWAIEGLKVGWFCPDYRRLRPSYSRILRTLRPLVTHDSKTEALIEVEGKGSIEFWSLADQDAGRSRDYDWVVLDEASLIAEGLRETFEQAIAPTLLDRRGRAVMAGTPKGIDPNNFFFAVCDDKELGWTEYHAPTRANPMLDAESVANLIKEYPPLVYQQEYLAEFVDWSGTAFFIRENLLLNGQPVRYPTVCDKVFATIDTATKTGKENDGTAVAYWARDSASPHPLTLLDWECQQISGDLLEHWLPNVFGRLQDLARQCRARQGSAGAWIEDKNSGSVLLQQCARRGLPAYPILSKLTSLGKEERCISVSGYLHRNLVKFSEHAFNKTTKYKQQSRNHMLTQVLNFRVGAKDNRAEDDLLDTFTYGVAISLGNAEGY